VAYRDVTNGDVHLALVRGAITPGIEILVRVHEPVSFIDLLDVDSQAHSWNLNEAMRAVAAADAGVIVLLHRSETGDALLDRLSAGSGSAAPPKMDLRT
jgi:3,4-dihydroxy 2-butanone 4-phosphate synthase/GTP cyclohydrolase II